MANINVRSPYLVRVTDTDLVDVELQIWIYTGTKQSSDMTTWSSDTINNPTYTLTSSAINDESLFDIAPLVKDYFDVSFSGSYSSDVVWVDYRYKTNSKEPYYIYRATFYDGCNTTDNSQVLYYGAYSASEGDLIATNTTLYTDMSLSTQYQPSSQITLNVPKNPSDGGHGTATNSYTIETNGQISLSQSGCLTGDLKDATTGHSEYTGVVDSILTLGTYGTTATQHTAFYGYGYFEDGKNYHANALLLTAMREEQTFYGNLGQNLYIPIDNSQAGYTATLYDTDDVPYTSYTTTGETDNTDVVQYFTADRDGYIDLDGEIYYTKFIEECKYTPYKVTFINKNGVLEDIWFFKNSKLSLETKEESYRSNILSSGTYSTNNHQYRTLYKEGKESLTINSGFYPEEYNEVFKQLLLSENVWIKYKSQTLPIRIKDSSMSFKTQIQDKLINYTMNIEFAYDKINNVR